MVILHGTYYNGPWVCVIKVCSNGGTTYIIGEIIAKDNLNIENFLQLQNYSTEFLDITHNSPWVCVIKVRSNGDATYIIGEIIAKDNLNIEI